MKKFFSLMVLLLCFAGQAWADTIEASTTDPSGGKPEHLYTMVNGGGYYANGYTAPTQTDANKALFAFYSAGVDNAYYIYCYTSKKWLSYTKAASYSNKTAFLSLTDSKTDGAYFKCNNCSDNYYEIAPYNTTSVASKYLNWYQGVGANNPLDGTVTLGLWQDNGSKDGGSRWQFAEVDIPSYTYTIVAPADVTVNINGTAYTNGQTVTSEGALKKSAVSATEQEGKFVIISVNDVSKTITISYATIPDQPATSAYTNAVLYPAQQDAVGEAQLTTTADTYTLYNNVLAASFVKANNALYFAGSNAMNLLPGTEIFTVAFGSGDNVPASAMTLNSVTTQTLTGESAAVGGAEHYNGLALVANYTYTYKGATVNIVWKAVLRDGSHYLRTEMELTGVNDVDMYNVIPLLYNVDTNAAGSTPATVGNTRGAVLMSNKIFAGLENPVAYNTVGDASGAEDNYTLTTTLDPVSLTSSSWTQVESASLPNRVIEATGANYPNVYAYTKEGVTLEANQKVEVTVAYTSGVNRLNFGGADLLDASNDVAASDYHSGFSGNEHSNNTFTFTAPYNGTFKIRVFVQNATEAITASSTMTVKIYTPKEGAAITTDVVGIQGLWSRNTTLAAGETWKISGVVGLIAQDGSQDNSNIHKTQKRRSFLAYSERERAVPWRANPCYISWYELNINRNNATDPTQNMNANQVLDVLNHWKSDFYDVYGVGPSSFVIDDGWDNYGTWTFHAGFPNEMRDIAALAAKMGAGVGAWLGPVGGYGTSGNYRRKYWTDLGQKMELSNPNYYATFKAAANNLTKNQGDFRFFKFDGISAQFSAVGPDAGDTGNENAEGIIRLERFVREELKRDIFFNTTVGTWASPFWYHYTDATWRQEQDYGTIGNNSIDRENWITYRDRLVYQNYVTNSPICPINTLMTHGFILSTYGSVSTNMDYEPARRELRCAFVCGSGMVELYNDYPLMNSINSGALWGDLAECIRWQKRNADVLPDAHWVGGNPWDGSKANVYGWASWNGTKATLALRNGSNSSQTYTFTLRDALNIPANVNGAMYFVKSFRVQDALTGFAEGTAIDYDTELTVTLPGSSVFAFDGSLTAASAPADTFTFSNSEPKNGSTVTNLSSITLTFGSNVGFVESTSLEVKDASNATVATAAFAKSETDATKVIVTLNSEITAEGTYRIALPEKFIFDSNADSSAEDKGVSNGATYNPAYTLTYTVAAASEEETWTLSEAITDAANLTNIGLYTIESAGRGHLLYDTTYPNNIASTSTSGITNTDPTGVVNERFCIIHTPNMTEGQYYLYSVGAGKFAGYSGTSGVLDFATYDEPNEKCIVTLTDGSNGNGAGFVFKFPNAGADYRINVTNPTNGAKAYGVKITDNKDVDDGSIMVVKQCVGATYDGFAAMMRKVYDVDGTTAAVQAIQAKSEGGIVGYPATTATAYTDLLSAYENGLYESAHLTNLYASTEVNKPIDGHAYTFTFKHMDGTRTYLYWNGSQIRSAVLGTGEALPETATFVCHQVDTKFMFVNPSSGNYLVWWGGSRDGAYESNNGYTSAYDSGKNIFEVIKFTTGSKVQATNEELYGCVGLKGKRNNSSDPNSYFILKNTAGGAVASSDPYVDKTTTDASYRTCAVMVEEVDYYNKLKFQTPVTQDGNDYASIYLPYAATVPTGATAYIGALNSENRKLTLTEITDGIIPKNTAVVMSAPTESALGTVYVAPATQAGTTETTGNILKGTVNADDRERDMTIYTYVLNGGYGEIGFYKYTANKLPLGRAYFEVANDVPASGTGAGVQGFLFDFGEEEGETTGINAAALSNGNAAKTYYDLSGRCVANPKNGLYICNGKKVYIK